MAPAEMTELKEIRGLIEGHIADFRVVKTKLFGDDESEDAQGRIPRIEATQQSHEKRIVHLERVTLLGRGMALLVLFIVGVVEFLYHVMGVFKH